MRINKALTTSLAAAAIIGAISVAYAQTAPSDANPGGAAPQEQLNNSAAPGNMSAPLPADSSTTGFQGERPAQADRN